MEEKKETKAANPKGIIDQFEAMLEEYMVKKAPFTIPKGGKDFIVAVAPYLVILCALILVPTILAGLGISAVLSPFMMFGVHYGAALFISMIFAIIALVLEIIAIPGLFAKKKKGWKMVFYSSIVIFIRNILAFNIIGGIIGAIVGWYILFQVKDRYN